MTPTISFRAFVLRRAAAAALFALCRIALAQSPQVAVFDGGFDDRGVAVATHASGAVYVGGSSASTTTAGSFAVVKYDTLGGFQWLARPSGLEDHTPAAVSDVATDPAGNVYAVGYAMKPLPLLQTDFAWVVASFDGSGVQRWAQLLNGAGNSFEVARAVSVVPEQGVYVVGITSGDMGRPDWMTVKYSLAGVEQWRRAETGVANADDQPVAIKVDAAGNSVVLGYVQPVGVSGPKDVRVVKRDAHGNVLWRRDYSHTATSDEFPSDLVLDESGNVYVTLDRSPSTNPELGNIPVTFKLDANGNQLFVIEGPGRGGSAIALDQAGNFIVSGVYADEAASNPTPATSKFSANGALLWSLPIHTTNLAVDDLNGTVYLTRGYTEFTGVKISSSGQLVWEQTVAQGHGANEAMVDPATGDFIVVGNSASSNSDIVTARFSAIGVPPAQTIPSAPSNLAGTAAKNSIVLSWTDNSANESGFFIERAIGSGPFVQITQVGANVRSFTSTGLNKKTTYTFRVRAFNTNGSSAYSNTVTAAPR
jgi:hypothetical protein